MVKNDGAGLAKKPTPKGVGGRRGEESGASAPSQKINKGLSCFGLPSRFFQN